MPQSRSCGRLGDVCRGPSGRRDEAGEQGGGELGQRDIGPQLSAQEGRAARRMAERHREQLDMAAAASRHA